MDDSRPKFEPPDDATQQLQNLLRKHFPHASLTGWTEQEAAEQAKWLWNNLNCWAIANGGEVSKIQRNQEKILQVIELLNDLDFSDAIFDYRNSENERTLQSDQQLSKLSHAVGKLKRFGITKVERELRRGAESLKRSSHGWVQAKVNSKNLTAIEFARITWKRFTGKSAPTKFDDSRPFWKFCYDFFLLLGMEDASMENAHRNWKAHRQQYWADLESARPEKGEA